MWANFAILAPVNMILIWVAFGAPILPAIGTGLLSAPVVILGSLIGVKVGSHIPVDLFRKILFALLIVLGIASIVSAFGN